jgi:hypothetical protein
VSNKDIVFNMPDTVNYRLYTNPNFTVQKIEIEKGYYYMLNQQASDTNVAAQNDSSIYNEQNVPAADTGITVVMQKMEKKTKLNDADYEVIDEFLLHNNDESLSEGAGSSLYEYLKNNKANNEAYLSFLNKKSSANKEKILGSLVQIMCIDLGEDNYTQEKLIKDFSMFKGSESAKKALSDCMGNQVK